jgi:hypothetical protein
MNNSDAPNSLESLWNNEINAENYISKEYYLDHVFEQYRTYIEMTDRISNRRNLANTFFLTLHSLILTGIVFLYEKLPHNLPVPVAAALLVAVCALCFVWWRLIQSYQRLNAAKFLVIGEYEKRLPTRPFVAAEWKALGEGKNPKIYRPLGQSEKLVPPIFAFLYLFVFALTVIKT